MRCPASVEGSVNWFRNHQCTLYGLPFGQLTLAKFVPAAGQLVNAGHVEGLAGGQAAGGLLLAGAAEPLGQAARAAQGVGLQLPGDAVAPVRDIQAARAIPDVD